MNKSLLVLSVLLISFFSSCDKSLDSDIPSLPVYLSIKTDLTGLSVPGAYKTYPKAPDASSYIGFGGVLVLCGYDAPEVFAFDMACPYEVDKNVRIKVDSNNIGVCAKCGSEFNSIFWGSPAPSSGPAFEKNLFLRRYNAFVQNMTITVTN